MAWGYTLGFAAAIVVYMLTLARYWRKDVTMAVTMAWFTNASIYAVVFGLAELFAIAAPVTGVYIGGPYAEAGFAYALTLLGQLLLSAFLFAVGFDISVELKREERRRLYRQLLGSPDAERTWPNHN